MTFPDPKDLAQLTEIFRTAGAENPESWARSQIEEGIPQLSLFSFAKSLWAGVESEDSDDWIDRQIENASKAPNAPCAQIGPSLKEMLDKGVSRGAITDLVRVMQYQVLFHVCSLLDGCHTEDTPVTTWALCRTDEEGNLVETVDGAHEILLGLDPTKREMRPRKPSGA